jgi:dipeptidase
MQCDAVVALGRATADGRTLFGHNISRPTRNPAPLRCIPGRSFTTGEKVRTQHLEIPQARQTCTVLGCQPDGCWGLECGLNEYQVAAGCGRLRSALLHDAAGLTGTDLVRLVLERSRTALQAVEHLTSLVERHGQGAFPGCPAEDAHDHVFLVADLGEAYVVEAAGAHWVYQSVREVRAVGNVRAIRQDWDRISPGLAACAIGQGWWPADGSKLDSAGALDEDARPPEAALRRWGQATLRLQEQNGRIDLAFHRRLLGSHAPKLGSNGGAREAGEATELCQHGPERTTTGSFVAALGRDLSVAWRAFGPPCASVYFPVFLEGELPGPFLCGEAEPGVSSLWRTLQRLAEQSRRDPERWSYSRDRLNQLQARFEQETEEFLDEGRRLQQDDRGEQGRRQATLFMQHTLERFEELTADLLCVRSLSAVGS